MLTVVDAANLTRDFASHDFLARPRRDSATPRTQRTLVELLVDQIEFADVIVLNKVTAAGPERLADARRIIRSLNPGARLIETDFCDVPLTSVFDTGLFDFEKARTRPLWVQELNGFRRPRSRNRGIRHRIVRLARPPAVRRPPDPRGPDRRHARASSAPRAGSGCETDPNLIFEYSVAGGLTDIRPLGRWWAAMPRSDWPTDAEARRPNPRELARAVRRPPAGARLHRDRHGSRGDNGGA